MDRRHAVTSLRAGDQILLYDPSSGFAQIHAKTSKHTPRSYGHGDAERMVVDSKSVEGEKPATADDAWAVQVEAKIALRSESGVRSIIPSHSLEVMGIHQTEVNDDLGEGRELLIVLEDQGRTFKLRQIYRGYDDIPFLMVRCELENRSEEILYINSLSPIYIGPGATNIRLGNGAVDWSWYEHGMEMSLMARTKKVFDLYHSLDRMARFALHPLHSWNHTIFGDSNVDEYAVVGITTVGGSRCKITLTVHGSGWNDSAELDACCELNTGTLRPGETVRSLEVGIGKVESRPFPALLAYTRVLAKRMGMKGKRHRTFPTAWSAWYTIGSGINEENVLKVARALARHRNVWPVEVIHLDYGWAKDFGNWEGNEKFPHGMKWMADQIKSLGFKPGIWVRAPVVNDETPAAKEHAELLIPSAAKRQGAYGTFFIDPRHPNAPEYFYQLFKKITQEWGYEYLKVEMMFDQWRQSYKKIREACTDEVAILDCTAHTSALGYADAIRVTNDVHPGYWTSKEKSRQYLCGPLGLQEGCMSSVLRYHENEHLFWIDPDGIALKPGVAERPDNLFGGAEIDWETQFYASIIGLSGGATVLYGFMDQVIPVEDNAFSRLVPSYGHAAEVVDFFTPGGPRLLNLRVKRPFAEWNVVGVLNWDDAPAVGELRAEQLDLANDKSYHVFDFWNWRYLGLLEGDMTLSEQQAHQCLLLSLREATGGLQLLSTSSHITQGGVELEDVRTTENGVSGRIRRPPGRHTTKLAFFVPEGRDLRCTITGREYPVRVIGRCVVEATLAFDTSTDFAVALL